MLNLFNMRLFPSDWMAPPKSFRPLVRWWWPGLDVEKEELIRELNELDEFGFGGVEIQPFLFGVSKSNRRNRAEYLHRFLTDYHFEILESVLNKAKELGLFVDLTICSSWPPGGTHIDHDKSMKILIMGTAKIKDNNKGLIDILEMNLSPYYKHEKLMEGIVGFVQSEFRKDLFKPVAACACKSLKRDGNPNYVFPKSRLLDYSSLIDLTSYIDLESNKIRYNLPGGAWRIFIFYGGPSCMTPMNDVRDDPKKLSLTLDHLDKLVIQFHLSKLLPENKIKPDYFGSTLRAIFTDSQELAAEWFWTPKFFEYFIEKRGYDIRKYLPVCLVPNRDNQFLFVFFQGEKPCYEFPDGMGDRLRYDYWLTVSDLFCEEFTKGISEHLQPKELKNRIQAYGIHADLLKCYGRADIPESEQLFAGGLLDFLKLAGSAAILYGKKEVSCESLVWADREYLTTPLKWKVAADRLFIAGINRMIYHGYPYFDATEEYPGYYPFNPPDFSDNFNRNNSFAPYFSLLNAYVSRGQYLMQTGTTEVEIAIFYPHFNYDYKQIHKEDLVGGFLEGYDEIPLKGLINWFKQKKRSKFDDITLNQQQLGQILTDNGYYYIHINEECILNGILEETSLCIGSAKLKVLIFPLIEAISLELANKLQYLSEHGINIIFIGSIPDKQLGFLNWQENDKKIRDIMNGMNKIFLKTNEQIPKAIEEQCNILPFIRLNNPVHRFGFIKKRYEDSVLYFIRNGDNKQIPIEFSVQEEDFYPYSLDLLNGTIEPFPFIANSQKEQNMHENNHEKNNHEKNNHEKNNQQNNHEKNNHEMNEIKMCYTFAPYQSLALVFKREPHSLRSVHTSLAPSETKSKSERIKTLKLESKEITPWTITYQEKALKLKKLIDLRTTDFRYISGPLQYSAEFTLSESELSSNIIQIEFKKIHEIAEISVNGTKIGVLFAPPYRLNIPKSLLKTQNHIVIKVTGCLRNRLVGLGKEGSEKWKRYQKKPIQALGIIGLVKIYFLK